MYVCTYVCYGVSASCYKPLGMQSGAIPDSALRASSSYDDSSVGPSYGRYSSYYIIYLLIYEFSTDMQQTITTCPTRTERLQGALTTALIVTVSQTLREINSFYKLHLKFPNVEKSTVSEGKLFKGLTT